MWNISLGKIGASDMSTSKTNFKSQSFDFVMHLLLCEIMRFPRKNEEKVKIISQYDL